MFFKKKKSNPGKSSAATVSRWFQKWDACLRKLAALLQQHSNRLPLRTIQYLLLAFCLLFVSVSVGIVVHSLQERSTTTLKIAPIQLLAPVLKTESEHTNDHPAITLKEYNNLLRFRQYLDSLRETPEGRYQHDRLLYGRRALLDSLRQFELLYQLQNLKQP